MLCAALYAILSEGRDPEGQNALDDSLGLLEDAEDVAEGLPESPVEDRMAIAGMFGDIAMS